jgi:hypothetical protein
MGEMPAQPDSSYRPQRQPNRGSVGRWQFSLGGLLLFVLFVAMGLSLFVAVRRTWQAEARLAEYRRQAEAELADYRREYGILKVENPTKLQAIALWTGEPHHWRWRVHFPRGRYDICCATAAIPFGGFPTSMRGCNADLTDIGEISVAACKDPKDGAWRYALSILGMGGGWETHTDMRVTPPEESMSESNDSVDRDRGPVTVSPNEPLVLLRRRAVKQGTKQMDSLKAYDGLMLWIRRTGPWRGDHTVRGWSNERG